MRSDLQELEITLGELKRLTTLKLKEVVMKGKKQIEEKLNFSIILERFLGSIFTVCFGITSIFCLGFGIFIIVHLLLEILLPDRIYPLEEGATLGGLALIIIAIPLTGTGILCLKVTAKKLKKKPLPLFVDEVNKHNQIILNIDVLDQLEAVGNPVKLNEREKVIEALKINRENLVRALKTERILKENPQFRPEQFNIDLSGLRALQATQKASEYGLFLDEALQIGVSVQTQMRKLENKSLN